MLKKLDDILKRAEFLSQQLLNPDVIADMSVWQKYSKEHADLSETADKYREYLECKRQMDDAFALAEVETDGEKVFSAPQDVFFISSGRIEAI